jgi:hypothetical protein
VEARLLVTRTGRIGKVQHDRQLPQVERLRFGTHSAMADASHALAFLNFFLPATFSISANSEPFPSTGPQQLGAAAAAHPNDEQVDHRHRRHRLLCLARSLIHAHGARRCEASSSSAEESQDGLSLEGDHNALRPPQLRRRAMVVLRQRAHPNIHHKPRRGTERCAAPARPHGPAHPHAVLHIRRVEDAGAELPAAGQS